MRIIAEIGQNHQGKEELALDYIKEFSSLGATSVKFQRRSLSKLFTPKALLRPYDNPNSFGETYGEHRSALELSDESYHKLIKKCTECNVEFICTPFDSDSVYFLSNIGCKVFKVSSFDIANLKLLKEIAQVADEIIISTGGAKKSHIIATYSFLCELNFPLDAVTFLHCVSLYPTAPENLNLMNLRWLRENLVGCQIGLSDHYAGVVTGPLGYALGARCFEKHVTFNRAWKGTDHSFALEPEGFKKYARDINVAKTATATIDSREVGDEPVFKKLGKSICYSSSLVSGHEISVDDLDGIISTEGTVPIRESYAYVGKKLSENVSKGQLLKDSDFSQ